MFTSAVALVLSHQGASVAEVLPRPKAVAPAKSSQAQDWRRVVREFDRSSRDSRRALLAAVVEQVRRNPLDRAALVGAAIELAPAATTDIRRAGEIGGLLAERERKRLTTVAWSEPASAGRQSNSSTGAAATGIATHAVRSAAFPTFDYMADRPTDDTWMAARPQLDGTFTAAQKQEFNANWGNLAVGQAAALNRTTLPDGTPLAAGLKGITGRNVVVAVIDGGIDAVFNANGTGFTSVHPEFAGRLDLRSRRDLDGGTFDRLVLDELAGNGAGHGTHVAGTIGAGFNGFGMMGIAPDATILALKAVRSGVDSDGALSFAGGLANVRIINGSYGPSFSNPPPPIWQTGNLTTEFTAVKKALDAGKILVYANGNDGNNVAGATLTAQQANPSGVALFPYIRPANAGKGIYDDQGANHNFSSILDHATPGRIVAVANVSVDLKIAQSSNLCGVAAQWCISAPGGGDTAGATAIASTFPRNGQTNDQTSLAPTPDGARYTYFFGTSMATPHVSGVLAVLIEAYPTYTPAQIVDLMFATADDLGAPGTDPVFGRGFVRLDRALLAQAVIGANQNAATNVAAGQKNIWTAPVNTTGTLTVNNAAGANAPAGMPMQAGTLSALSLNYVSSPVTAPLASPTDPGELVIAGEASFGAVNVTSGALVVEGELTSPTVTVGANSLLTGSGDIIGNVVVHGVLNPAEGPAEMYVEGNVTIAAGGKLQIDVDGNAETGGPGSYDALFVAGSGNAFTAGGTLAARFRGIDEGAFNDYTPSIGTKFTIVYADLGATIKGSFANVVAEPDENGVTGMPNASRLDVLYYPDAIVMAVTPASYANLAANGVWLSNRQRAIGNVLDAVRPAPAALMSSSLMDVFDPVYGLSLAELPGALDQMSGAGYGGMTTAALDANMQFATALQGRFSALRNGAAAAQAALPPSLAFSNDHRVEIAAGLPAAMAYAAAPGGDSPTVAAGWTAWGQAFASTARVGADANGPSWMSRGGGAVFGVDKAIDATLVVGAAGFYASSLTTSDGLRGTTESYAAAAYGAYTRGAWELGGVLGGGWSTMTADRQLSFGNNALTAHGSTSGAGVIASIEAGHRVSFATSIGAAFVKPIAGFGYTTLHRNAFTETGGGGFNLTVLGDRPSRATSTLGVVSGVTVHGRDGLTWWPELRLAWTHDFRDVSPIMQASLLGQSFQTQDANPGRDAAQVGLQLTAAKSSALQVFGGYTGTVRANATAHQAHLGLRARW